MLNNDFRIAKVQRTLRWFEEDIPLLNMRVKELSKERQESARKFAAAVIDQTRAELERLLREQPHDLHDAERDPLRARGLRRLNAIRRKNSRSLHYAVAHAPASVGMTALILN